MVEKPPELEEIIEHYRAMLETLGIHTEKIYLFGSHMEGNPREGSDIDLIVVSSDWERFDFWERLETLGVAAARILEPIEAQGFTPKEIAEGSISSFWKDILENEAVPM